MANAAKGLTPTQRKQRRKDAVKYRGNDKELLTAKLMEEQAGKCKLCGLEGTRLSNGRIGLVLDHCHATGKARKLLCNRCNMALGLLNDNTELLARMAEYVDGHRARP
jgi:hypothetical protein